MKDISMITRLSSLFAATAIMLLLFNTVALLPESLPAVKVRASAVLVAAAPASAAAR